MATGPTLTFQQIIDLWNANGGPPGWAPLMAGIAIAESGGNTVALNNTPATGDYSVGLWQINYYNGLLASRTNSYGSPAALQADPNLQAKAAISLFGGGPGITNWKNDPTWRKWVAAGSPSQPSAATVQSWLGGAGSSSGSSSGATATGSAAGGPSGVGGNDLSTCVLQAPGFLFLSGPCFLTKGGVKWLSGMAAVMVGTVLAGVGVLVLASVGFESSGAKKAVNKVAGSLPVGPGKLLKAGGAAKAGGAPRAAPSATPRPAPSPQPRTAGRIESRQIERRFRETERQQGPIGPRGGNPTAGRIATRERRGTSIPGPGSAQRRARAQQPF